MKIKIYFKGETEVEVVEQGNFARNQGVAVEEIERVIIDAFRSVGATVDDIGVTTTEEEG
jgi:hypothetical protein